MNVGSQDSGGLLTSTVTKTHDTTAHPQNKQLIYKDDKQIFHIFSSLHSPNICIHSST